MKRFPSPRVIGRVKFLFCVVSSCLCASSAWAAAPTLTHLSPAGGQRGTKVSVTCAGSFTWPVSVFAPGVEVSVGQESGKLEVTIPTDLETDRVWIRLHSAEGASAALPFLIGNLKEIAETEPNNSPKNAQQIADSAVTINGALIDADVDGFQVNLSAGQTLVANVDGNTKLGSPMDSILQVASADGFVLADNHDEVGLDPRIVFTAKKTGTYIVRLFGYPSNPDTTIAYRGAANYIYRLTLTTGPYVTHSIPLAHQKDTPDLVVPIGWNIPEETKLPVVVLGGERLSNVRERETLADLRNHSDAAIGFVNSPTMAGSARVRIVPFAVHPGIANGTMETPIALQLPVIATG
ncbi:MAG: hypothetical protein FJ267_15790, partial [Planctomycetes bacterium]|nr:hypothetical protein [Planctomycetota bacterium]